MDITEDMVNWDWNFPYKGQNFDRAKKYLSRSKLENYDGSGATDIYIKLANLNNGQKQITILTGDKGTSVSLWTAGHQCCQFRLRPFTENSSLATLLGR